MNVLQAGVFSEYVHERAKEVKSGQKKLEVSLLEVSLLEALIWLRKERGALPVQTALTPPAYYRAHAIG